MGEKGTLYLVATPIGHLEDISLRALRVLSEVNLIAAEDTRRTKILLNRYEITTPLTSFHARNQVRKAPELIRRLEKGESIAVVSDAGTPGISDPAGYLVAQAVERGLSVVPVPGPTAFVSALVVSGLPTHRFVFEGFLPHKKGRKKRLEGLQDETRTIVLYESPHRLLRTLQDLKQHLGDRRVAIGRELTKKFEEILRGTIGEVMERLSQTPVRGEFVIVIEGKKKKGST